MEWRGPFLIVGRVNDLIYTVQDLDGSKSQDVHVNRLHLFYPGNLSPDQLLAESAKQEEYYVEAVLDHSVINQEFWFLVKWLGFEYQGPESNDSWVRYSDCKDSPAIKNYISQKQLSIPRGRKCRS